MVLGTIIWFIAIICAVLVIYDIIVNNKKLSDGMKILWVVCAVLFSIITAIVYYFAGRNGKNDFFKQNKRR
jgi:membrane protein DedA with SNARE-associated domain